MKLRIPMALGAGLLLCACPASNAQQQSSLLSGPAPLSVPLVEQGMVSAADPRAAEAGAEMLRAGGSATDAAIATMLALTVVEPQSSGIGGGGFFVRAQQDGSVETIDGRETAPAAARPDWFMGADGQRTPYMQAVMTGLSVGVPGNLRLAEEAHRRHGQLAWAELFAPAIQLARDGFLVTERFHDFLIRAKGRAIADDAGKALFYQDNGEPLAVGSRIQNPALAETLEKIAENGPEAFYTGENAVALAQRVASATPHPAGMTVEDLAQYKASARPPVCGTYRTFKICGMGPPSSGATTVLAILKQLEGFDLAALGPRSPVSWHLFAESQRLAYADREMFLGDSDFVSVPVHGLVDNGYTARRGALISADRSMQNVVAGSPPPGSGPPIMSWADGDEPEEHGTSHFAVTDKWGNAVSYTSTIEGPFGSGMVVGGYYLNNELTDFSFTPERDGKPVANRVEGGKRPRSSMAPTVVFNSKGQLVLAIGAAGGSTIPVQVSKALIGYLDWGLTAQEAIALPGLYSPGDTLFIEPDTWLEEWLPQFEALGHKGATTRQMPFKANAVEWRENKWVGAADPRSEGVAVAE